MTTTTEAPMDLQSMTPAQIDALWFPLMEAEAVADAHARRYENLAADTRQLDSYRQRYYQYAEDYRAKEAAARDAAAPYRAEWDRRDGWTRAYLAVTNGDGHIHSVTLCRTCNRGAQMTRFARLPQVSGLPESEIIDLAGERACTVCYPGAPVDTLKKATRLFSADEEAAAAAKAAKAAAKAAKDAKKAAAAITNPDGTPLVIDGWKIETERTAWTQVVDYSLYARIGYPPHAADCERIMAALAAKTGRTVEDVHAEVEAKVIAKARREKITLDA